VKAPLRMLVTIWVLAAAAAIGLTIAVATTPVHVNGRLLLLTPQLFVLLLLAQRYPVQLAPKTKTSVASSTLFAAVLLLPPPISMALVALATFGAQSTIVSPVSLRRPPWFQILFNTSEKVLEVGVGELIFQIVSGHSELINPAPGRWLAAVPLTAAAMCLLGLLVVDFMVGVQTRRRPFTDFWRRWKFILPQETCLFLLGVLVAAVATYMPWAVWLLAVPSFVVYRSLRDGIALRVQTQDALLELAAIVDMRDHYTFQHSQRVAELARATALKLRLHADDVLMVEMAGRVHDVGKIGIKSTVLMKPGGLTDREWREMRSHPELGARLVSKFPQFARGKDLVLSHHERYDGKGYPRGLAGEAIPLGGRILGVADAWDAMTSNRAYRQALDMNRVYGELERCRGKQFDPAVLDAFLQVLAEQPELAVPHTGDVQDVDEVQAATQLSPV